MSRNVQDLMGKNITFDKFSLDEMTEHPAIVIVAKRGSGKSVVTQAIMNHFKTIPVGIIISPTEEVDPFFSYFFPDSFIYYKFETDIISSLLIRQEEIKKKRDRKAKKGKTLDIRAYGIMDDCLAEAKGWINDDNVRKLLYNGRHYSIMYILTMQYPLGIPPSLRANFDYVFLLADDNISNLKKMHENYAGMFPDFNSFRNVFNELTKDFGAMVILNRGARANFFDKIKWYKAPYEKEQKNIHYGCKQFRYFHKKNYDKHWTDKISKFNFEAYANKKKKSRTEFKIKKSGE
jgi:hypothetical protein